MTPSATASVEATATAGAAVSDPEFLHLACDGRTTILASTRVRAVPDGVHLQFTNTSGGELPYTIDDATGLAMLGDSIGKGGSSVVETFGNGEYRIGCGGVAVPFSVVDPDGIYVPAAMACAGGSMTAGTIDYAPGATGPRGSVLDIAHAELRGLAAGDVVERAGYPRAAGEQLVRVVRGGNVVAVLRYAADGGGGWLISGTSVCPETNLGVEAPG